MTSRIMTAGTANAAIRTRREAGEGLRDWIVRHAQAVNTCSLSEDNLAPAESDEGSKQLHSEACAGQISSSPPLS